MIIGYVHIDSTYVEQSTSDVAALIDSTRARDGRLFYAVALYDPLAGRMLAVERRRDQAALTTA